MWKDKCNLSDDCVNAKLLLEYHQRLVNLHARLSAIEKQADNAENGAIAAIALGVISIGLHIARIVMGG